MKRLMIIKNQTSTLVISLLITLVSTTKSKAAMLDNQEIKETNTTQELSELDVQLFEALNLNDDEDSIIELIKEGANVHARNPTDQWTLLHYAAYMGYENVTQLLLE